MKSLSLLTMVFLPATAIASVMAPFIAISEDGNHIRMSSQFWVFWAIATPITVVVLVTWLIWIQRVEFAKRVKDAVSKRKAQKERKMLSAV